jgi:hypothetical protein
VTLHVTFNKSNSSVSGDVPIPQITMVEPGLRRDGATMTSAERERVQGLGRLEDGLRQAGDWYLWGPYVSERQWGTVREDYSADGAGLGASHQTGWTGLVADLIRGRPSADGVHAIADLGRVLDERARP